MVHYRDISLYLFTGIALMGATVTAADTQDPSVNCLGGPAFGLDAACDFNNFGGLHSHPPSEILYEIIQQADLPNDTFYANGSHVTCLFADKNFVLDFGASAGGGGAQVGFNVNIDISGTVCVYPEDVPKGGMTLGEIRQLSRAMIDHCAKCGRMSVNYLSRNENQTGWLKFNWQDPASCQKPCIDPSEDLKTSNTTNSSAAATPSSAAKRTHGNPIWVLNQGVISVGVVWAFAFLFGVAIVVG